MTTAISQPASDPVNAVPPGPGVLVPDPPRTLVEAVCDAVGKAVSEGVSDPEGLTDPEGDTLWDGVGLSVGLGQSIRAVTPTWEK